MSAATPRRGNRDHNPGLPIPLPVPLSLPGRIVPEMASPCIAPFDAPDWRFTVDWDGSRTLLFAGPTGDFRLQNERGRDVTARYPELADAASMFAGRAVVVDGVIAIVDAEGRPDLGALGARLVGAQGATNLPVVYLATDLLYLDGMTTVRWSLDRRHRALQKLIADDLRMQVCDLVPGEGHAFAAAASARSLPAILARRGRAAYHAGVASPDRLRIALEDRTNAAVVAISGRDGHEGESVLTLAETTNAVLAYAGTVRLGSATDDARWLDEHREALRRGPIPGFKASGPGLVWIEPSLVATVRHRGRHPDGSLRMPDLVALRDDVDPRWCVRRDHIQPPTGRERGFLPTVLSNLPLPETAGSR